MSKLDARSLRLVAAASAALLFASPTVAHARQLAGSRPTLNSQMESTPFDPASTKLPPNYAGTDLRALLSALEARRARLVKDEFETTAQHQERVRAEESKPLHGSLKLDSLLAAVIPATSIYDADAELMKITADLPAHLDEVFFKVRESGAYAAKVKMDIPTARSAKPELRALLVFNLTPPFMSDKRLTAAVREVWFFNRATGEVLEKAAKPESPTDDTELNEIARLVEAGQEDEALSKLRAVLLVSPMNARAYLLAGKIFLKRGETTRAINQFKTAIFWDSDNTLIEPHVLLARIFLERGDRAQALAYTLSASKIDPGDKEVLALRTQLGIK